MILQLIVLLHVVRNNFIADISYVDLSNALQFVKLDLFVKSLKGQHGVKFGLNIFNQKVENCQLVNSDQQNNIYATYVDLADQKC